MTVKRRPGPLPRVQAVQSARTQCLVISRLHSGNATALINTHFESMYMNHAVTFSGTRERPDEEL